MFTTRIFSICAALSWLAAPLGQAQPAAYVIADSTTGTILESSAPQKKLQVGSLTKISMAMTVIDWARSTNNDLNQLATVPGSVQTLGNNTGIGLRVGDTASLRDLLYAALLQSDNLAAETLAEHVGRALGTNLAPAEAFVAQMNAQARHLGMTRTRFLNPHGLEGLERALPYSTAEDLAKLTQYAMSNTAFRFFVSQKERKVSFTSGTEASQYLLCNTNELLGKQSIDGVKTGTTKNAGSCVIISAARPPESRQEGTKYEIIPRRLNIVVLNEANRFDTASQLLTHGWELYDAWAAAGRPAKGKQAPR
jgi:serine-type D-Ala-D-Ala carboxypeptidase (penicillin-binding protein 5/6)